MLTLILPFLANCSMLHNVPGWKHDIFDRPVGDEVYPPLYIEGWRHGCESGAQASAHFLYRFRYKFKQDWKLLSKPLYKRGWEDAYNFCRKYILQHNYRAFR